MSISSRNIVRGLALVGLLALFAALAFLVLGLGVFPNGGRPVLVDGAVAPDGTQFVLEVSALGDSWVVGFDVKRPRSSWRRYVLDGDDFYWDGSLSIDSKNHTVVIRNYDVAVADFRWDDDRLTMRRGGEAKSYAVAIDNPFAAR
jgi:hypothetical protein